MSSPALTPNSGGSCILSNALKPADIIVTTSPGLTSGAIKAATASSVSHALLYMGNGNIIEAGTSGVVERSITSALKYSSLAVAYRYKKIGSGQAVVNQAKQWTGKSYDYVGAAIGNPAGKIGCNILLNPAICAAIKSLKKPQDKFFCSELVLNAYKKAGYPLVMGSSDYSSPQTIVTLYESGNLEYIGHLKW